MFGSRYKRLASEATEATAESILIAHEDAEQLARALGESELPISEEDHFRAVLAVKGLSETKIAVLVARLVEGLTFQEIARELGYADAGTAGRAFRDAVDIFKRKHNEKK